MDTLPANVDELPYLRELFLMLIAALVVAVALHRLRVSPVLGYLAAGVAIGPSGLSIIGGTEDIRTFAELGVVFLLFLIGLELSWQRLRMMRRLVFGLGGLQVAVTALAIGLIAWAWGNTAEAAIVLGIALALSSTAVVIQLLIERGEIASRVGRVSFAVLIFQDLAVVPLLVLVPALAAGSAGGGLVALESLLLALAKAAGAIVLLLLAGRYLLRLPFRWVVATRSAELFVALVLLIVLGTGWLTQIFGLSMALGAFLAGLALAETEFRHQIETDIKPFKGLLLGLFFISVGMSIDLGLIAHQVLWIVAAVIGLVGLKAVILTGIGIAFRLPKAVALRTGILLAEGGEFAFVVVTAAMAAAVVPESTGHFMLAVTGISILLTPGLAVLGDLASRHLAGAQGERDLGPGESPGDDLEAHVVIAGFGRVGQTVAELLEQQKVPYVAVDLDADRVKESRTTYGRPVYFGDATRPDLLDRLGAGHAAAFVVTLDDPDAAKRVVGAVASRWPRVKMFVRAHDRTHVSDLKAIGADEVVPETLESSLSLARHALRAVGTPMETETILDERA